jgi:hypothetical protein
MPQRAAVHVGVVAAYLLVLVAFAWPLPAHLSTHLTGSPTGDTGVYVWNHWVFQREVLEQHRLPYFTDRIFATSGTVANLSLHNYTPFQNLVALPLMTQMGVVASFNLVFLLMRLLTAYTTFLLARHVTGRSAEAWIAGLLFAWSPLLITRGTGHFSLVAAAPLAVFLLLLAKRGAGAHWLADVGLGAAIAWATSTDVYYGVYCLLIGAMYMADSVVSVERRTATEIRRGLRLALDLAIGLVGALVVAVAATGGGAASFAGVTVRMHSLYTPVLALTMLMLARGLVHLRIAIRTPAWSSVLCSARATVVAGVTASLLLFPLLYAVAVRWLDGRMQSDPVYWRSSPDGVDLLAFFSPNPNHPLLPDGLRAWLMPGSEAYLENVVSLPLVAVAFLLAAMTIGWRPARWWALLAAGFGLLALGPFVHVAGLNTFAPGPWAFLRYVPVAGLARTPARFSVVLMLAFAILSALALTWLGQHYPRRRRALLATVTVLLLVELLPAPRPLLSAEVPSIYTQVKAAPGQNVILQLPFGVRDGTSSAGNFNARTMYFQTAHGKPIIGGYLSRVSQRRISAIRSDPVLDLLMSLSAGEPLTADQEARLAREAPAFLKRSGTDFVVIHRDEFSAHARQLVVASFGLVLSGADGDFELYRPVHR